MGVLLVRALLIQGVYQGPWFLETPKLQQGKFHLLAAGLPRAKSGGVKAGSADQHQQGQTTGLSSLNAHIEFCVCSLDGRTESVLTHAVEKGAQQKELKAAMPRQLYSVTFFSLAQGLTRNN